MPVAWHPSRWWDWCMSEDQKKETEKRDRKIFEITQLFLKLSDILRLKMTRWIPDHFKTQDMCEKAV